MREKLSHPVYKPPLRFVLRLRLQKGGRICGTLRYYAIAYATALSLGQDLSTLVFYQSEMRRHLFKLLKEKKLTMFQVLKKKQSVRVTEGNPILVAGCRKWEI